MIRRGHLFQKVSWSKPLNCTFSGQRCKFGAGRPPLRIASRNFSCVLHFSCRPITSFADRLRSTAQNHNADGAFCRLRGSLRKLFSSPLVSSLSRGLFQRLIAFFARRYRPRIVPLASLRLHLSDGSLYQPPDGHPPRHYDYLSVSERYCLSFRSAWYFCLKISLTGFAFVVPCSLR